MNAVIYQHFSPDPGVVGCGNAVLDLGSLQFFPEINQYVIVLYLLEMSTRRRVPLTMTYHLVDVLRHWTYNYVRGASSLLRSSVAVP